jgi:hypothetical protein
MSVDMKPFNKDQFMGCVSAMFAATKTERSGEYICSPAIPEEGSKLYQDDRLAEQLMLTRRIVKDTMGEGAIKGRCPFEFY